MTPASPAVTCPPRRRPGRLNRRVGLLAAFGVVAASMAAADRSWAQAPASPAGTSPAAAPATGPATAPATRPTGARAMSADEMLNQAMRPPTAGPARSLPPAPDVPGVDRTSGPGAVKPNAPAVPTLREGTMVRDQQGRLLRSADGTQAEFVFEADGKAMRDPPMVVIPSQKLMMMENANAGSNRDLKFRVTGTVTEYRGRNYILLEKVTVIPDVTQQF